MRLRIPQLLITLSLISSSIAAPPPQQVTPATVEEDVVNQKPTGSEQELAPADGSTVFNGLAVPPMKDINGNEFKGEIQEGYWFVKHFSPSCPHCIAIAPTWQTLYEFYYTSKPIQSQRNADHATSLNGFHGFYDFHFASLNCEAWGDACYDNKVTAYPTFILYEDGVELKRYTGKKSMEGLSGFIEETLDSIKPGSRPQKGLKLPQAGDTSVEASTEPDVAQLKGTVSVGSSADVKHEEVSAIVTSAPVPSPTTTETKAGLEKKPTAVPNSAGTSVDLTPESFQKLVTTTQDPWFIKFYAPWCHHCQAMAPNWAQMAREMQGKLNIGEVNCDAQKRLCKDVHVRAYPTIHFFRGGERVEYDGLRGFGDLVSFAKNALDIGMGVTYVDAVSFKEMEEKEEVIFVYFYDHATTDEDFAALDRLTLSLIGHAKLVKTDDKILADRFKIHSWPRLLVSRDGRPSYYNALAPKDMRDFRQVLEWMRTVWLPIVPELMVSNSREIMNGRYVVLGILSRDRADEFILDKKEIKNAALEWMDREVTAFRLERQEMRDSKQLRIEEAEDRDDQRALRSAKSMRIQITEQDRQQIGFAWVDGVYWERWLRTTYGIDVKDGERVVVNDEDNKRYWDTTVSGAPIIPSRSSILETLSKITADTPKISPKYTTNRLEQLYFQAKAASRTHPWLSSTLFVVGIIFAATWGRRRMRRARGSSGGFIQLNGKEGLLGTVAPGKVD